MFQGHANKVVAELEEHYRPESVSEESAVLTFRADWGRGWILKQVGEQEASLFMPFCISCGEVINPGYHKRGLLCWRCREAQQKEQARLVAEGAVCTCGRCKGDRPGGFDWASGEIVTGEHGLCEACFIGAVNQITAVIQSHPGGPLPALVVMAAGTSVDRREDFARGKDPTDEEFGEAMDSLVRRDGRYA